MAAAESAGQTPGPGQVFLDHVGWFVADIDRAEANFTRLGFTLTPFSAQNNADPLGGAAKAAGTGNHCAMLGQGYLEILTAIPGMVTPLAEQLRAGIARYNGIHLIALTIDDAEAAGRRLEEHGFAPEPVVHLRRPVETADGGAAEVAFSVVRLAPGAMPEGRVQMLVQRTPELAWQDRFITRDNGVTGLFGVLLCVTDPAEAADRFARYAGKSAAGDQAYSSVQLDRGRLGFVTPDRCRELLPEAGIPCTPFIAAIGLAALDPAATGKFMSGRGVDTAAGADGLVHVPAMEAMGATLVIHPAGEEWPPSAG